GTSASATQQSPGIHPVTSRFIAIFGRMADPRRTHKGNLRHPLCDILFLMVSAAISGMDNWQAVVLFGQHRLDWLRRFFPYRYGIPSPDTLERFFGALEPAVFSRFFMERSEERRVGKACR